MIREEVLSSWTRVSRLIRGEVVQTTCCCSPLSAGGSRRDCQKVIGNKTPCRCACHGHKLNNGIRFLVADGESLPDRTPVQDKFYRDAKAEIAEMLARLREEKP